MVLDCLAPWWPDRHHLGAGAKVINIGPDPIFSRTPVRNFRSDLSIAGENHLTVRALIDAMAWAIEQYRPELINYERLEPTDAGWPEVVPPRAAPALAPA